VTPRRNCACGAEMPASDAFVGQGRPPELCLRAGSPRGDSQADFCHFKRTGDPSSTAPTGVNPPCGEMLEFDALS
jgi:hypothetical protein